MNPVSKVGTPHSWFPKAVIRCTAESGNFGLIVLKNSEFRLPHFSINFHCVSKVQAICPKRVKTASHIAKSVYRPTP